MTDRAQDEQHQSLQERETRDIRLPPLPPPPPNYHAPENEPTDQLAPPGDPDRQSTLAFDSPPADVGYSHPPFDSPGTPAPPTAVPPDSDARKWPWVLLVLLPLVVIVAAGLVLARLLGGG